MSRKWLSLLFVALFPVPAFAAPPAAGLPPLCATAVATTDPTGFHSFKGTTNFDAIDSSHVTRKKWLTEAARSQFVTIKDRVGGFQPGEPLLVVDCALEMNRFAEYVVVGLNYKVGTLKPNQVVMAPKSFTLPAAPKPPEFSVNLAYNKATMPDYDAVKGSHDLVEKRGHCEDSGIAAAQAAEKKVHDGPNYDQRRRDAGASAHATAFERCFGPKLRTAYEDNAKKIFELASARDAAAFDEFVKKFQ